LELGVRVRNLGVKVELGLSWNWVEYSSKYGITLVLKGTDCKQPLFREMYKYKHLLYLANASLDTC
jgi:hypothetical protein